MLASGEVCSFHLQSTIVLEYHSIHFLASVSGLNEFLEQFILSFL